MSFIPELNQQFFVNLEFIDRFTVNAALFLNLKNQAICGKVCFQDEKHIVLWFKAALELVEVSLKVFERIQFFNCVPAGKVEFMLEDFLTCDPIESSTRIKANFQQIVSFKSRGIVIEHRCENEDLYLDSSSSTRSKWIKQCFLKELHDAAPTAELEVMRVQCEEMILISTPLFNPYESLMNLFILLATKTYQSLGPLRNCQDAVVELHYCRNVVEKLAAPLFEIFGWEVVEPKKMVLEPLALLSFPQQVEQFCGNHLLGASWCLLW